MKRRIALLLSVLMVFTLLSSGVSLANEDVLGPVLEAATNTLTQSAKIVHEENFDSWTGVNGNGGWRMTPSATGKITLETDPANGNQYLRLEDNGDKSPMATLTFKELFNGEVYKGGTVLLEFDVKTEEILLPDAKHEWFGAAVYAEGGKLITKVENDVKDKGYVFYMQYLNEAGVSANNPLLSQEAYQDGEWYRIGIEIDTDGKKVKGYFYDRTDNLLGFVDFGGWKDGTASGVESIKFQGVSKSMGYISIDNLTVTRINAQEDPGGEEPGAEKILIDPSKVLNNVSHNPIGIVSNHLYDSDIYYPDRAKNLAQSVKELGVKTMRFGEGEAGDRYLWTGAPYPTEPGSPLTPQLSYYSETNFKLDNSEKDRLNPDGTYKNTQDFNEFMQIVEETGVEPFVVVGLDAIVAAPKADWAKTREQLKESAVQWVRYANVTNQWNVKYWEIGNESYLEGHTMTKWDPVEYVAVFKEFVAAMKAVDPTIKVGVPIHTFADWNRVILTELSDQIDFLIVHLYSGISTTALDTVISDIERYCRPEDRERIKISITETSVYASGNAEPNNINVAVNYAAKIGMMLEYEKVNYFHFWVTRRNLTSKDVRSALDDNGNILPIGQAMSIWSQFLGDTMVSATGAKNSDAFATYSPSDGKLNVLLTNRQSVAVDVNVQLQNFVAAESNEKWVYKGTSPEDIQPVFAKSDSVAVHNGTASLTLEPCTLTVITFLAPVTGIQPVSVSTTPGTAPELPTVVTAVYNGSPAGSRAVIWNPIDPQQYTQPGSFTVQGAAEGTDIPATAVVTVTPALMEADTIAPIWINPTLTASAITSSGLILSWNGAHDDTDVVTYAVYKDNVLFAALGTESTYQVTNLTAGTRYNFKIEAGDAAGNWSVNGPDITATTLASGGVNNSSYPGPAAPTPAPTPSLTPTPTHTPAPAIDFPDVGEHWAAEDINKLAAFGCISGYPDGTFKPGGWITRAEFVKILVSCLQLKKKDSKIFSDTEAHWARDIIATAYSHGIVSGYDGTIFGPDKPLTREHMAIMIVNALKLPVADEETDFRDVADLSHRSKAAIAIARKYDVINGYPDMTFKPMGSATRAEAAVVVARALKLAE
ncbi:MAG: S-layer domain protein [Paenibacillaceae bacterium]|jgi:hypothetical protein|nr:S-layer domain protein [Paenibacillaceae bacterium]